MAIMSRFNSLLSTLLFVLPVAITALNPGFPYGEVKVRGVNLGGWLLTEVLLSGLPSPCVHRLNAILTALDHSFALRQDRR